MIKINNIKLKEHKLKVIPWKNPFLEEDKRGIVLDKNVKVNIQDFVHLLEKEQHNIDGYWKRKNKTKWKSVIVPISNYDIKPARFTKDGGFLISHNVRIGPPIDKVTIEYKRIGNDILFKCESDIIDMKPEILRNLKKELLKKK